VVCARAWSFCHHPKWPRRCPLCGKLALGFNVTIPIRGNSAWGTGGIACDVCNVAHLPSVLGEGVTREYIQSLVERDFPGLKSIRWMENEQFTKDCCLPTEEEMFA